MLVGADRGVRSVARRVGSWFLCAVLVGAAPVVIASSASAADPDGPVEPDAGVVEELTSETRLVEQLPDGTLQATFSVQPVRTVDETGAWQDLDATLHLKADGTVAPTRVLGELALSGGGPAGSEIASYATDDYRVALSSPFVLPAPALEGAFATYVDVVPDVDLVVEATAFGFSHNWVLKTPQAATDAQITELTLPLELDGLEPREVNGGTAYVDEAGVQQLWTPTPVMWDSAHAQEAGVDDVASVQAVADGPVGQDVVAAVDATVTTDEVVLRPDAGLLTDSDVTYPVVVDPSFGKTRSGWTAVWNNFPNKSFWQTAHSLGAGYEGWQQNKIVRSYFRFKTAGLASKTIVTAKVRVKQIHQASCNARETQMYRTETISNTTTWNKQPTRKALQDTNKSTAGCSGKPDKFVSWDVAKAIKGVAKAGDATATFMLRGASESDRLGWKQFDDAGAELTVNYFSAPSAPSGVFLRGGNANYSCGSPSLPKVIGESTLFPTATVKSADGTAAKLRAVFDWERLDAGGIQQKLSGAEVASGKPTNIQLTGLVHDKTYRFRVKTRAYYTTGSSTTVDGRWWEKGSGTNNRWCYFKIDLVKPLAPKLSSIDFAECVTTNEPTMCEERGEIDVPGAVTATSLTTDTVSYKYRLNAGPLISVSTAAGAARTWNFIPDREGLNTLIVFAVDVANNESASTEFQFKVGGPKPTHRWTFDGIPAANSGSATGGDLNGALDVDPQRGRVDAALRLDGQGGPSATTSASAGFAVGFWVRAEPAQAANRVVVAATSAVNSDVLRINWDAPTSRWTVVNPSTGAVLLASEGVAEVWTHLAVSSDASTMKFFVNGVQQGTHAAFTPAAPMAGWSLGCSRTAGSASNCFAGLLDEVNLFQRSVGVQTLELMTSPPRDPLDNKAPMGTAALWTMNEADSSPTALDSVHAHHLAMQGTAHTFGASDHDSGIGPVLRLNGSSSQAGVTNGPVVDTRASFAISAWAALTDLNEPVVIAEQRDGLGGAWTLGYLPIGVADEGGQWVFRRTGSNGTVVAEVRSEVTQDTGWRMLTAAYDASTQQLQLFIDADEAPEQGDGTVGVVAAPMLSRGPFVVGAGTLSGVSAPLNGEVDDVKVWVGLMELDTVSDHWGSAERWY